MRDKDEEMMFLCLCNGGDGCLYNSGGENMNGRHLMRVNKRSKRIMNLEPILVFRESWCIKFGGWWE